jgi:hypothetical protein
MKTISKVELAVDEIRLKIYDQTKDMTLAERREYYRKLTAPAVEKFAFTTIETAAGQQRAATVNSAIDRELRADK